MSPTGRGKRPASKTSTGTPKKAAAKKAGAAKPKAKAEGSPWAYVFTPRAPGEKRYWLVKSEPSTFSFGDLLSAKDRTTQWDGVRNFVARNFMRDGMKLG